MRNTALPKLLSWVLCLSLLLPFVPTGTWAVDQTSSDPIQVKIFYGYGERDNRDMTDDYLDYLKLTYEGDDTHPGIKYFNRPIEAEVQKTSTSASQLNDFVKIS